MRHAAHCPGDSSDGGRTVHLWEQVVVPYLDKQLPAGHPLDRNITWRLFFRRKDLIEAAKPVLFHDIGLYHDRKGVYFGEDFFL